MIRLRKIDYLWFLRRSSIPSLWLLALGRLIFGFTGPCCFMTTSSRKIISIRILVSHFSLNMNPPWQIPNLKFPVLEFYIKCDGHRFQVGIAQTTHPPLERNARYLKTLLRTVLYILQIVLLPGSFNTLISAVLGVLPRRPTPLGTANLLQFQASSIIWSLWAQTRTKSQPGTLNFHARISNNYMRETWRVID